MSSQSPAGPPPETPSAQTHEIQRGLASARETTTPGTPSPRPEMLGLWTSWVESFSKLASDMGAAPGSLPGQAPRQMSPDQLTAGLQQIGEMAAKDSILGSILRATDCRMPIFPLFGYGQTQLQPVHVEDVAEAIARAMQSLGRTPRLVAVPFGLWRAL